VAQDPFLVDQVQIEPGAAGTRLIRRATDGSLEFLDSLITGGITLSSLASLSLGGLMVVGKSGAGAQHSTIQAALDCIPSTSGPTEPYVVLVGPGVYNETVNIVRDWVFVIGLGGAVLEPLETTPNGPGAYHTVVVQADLGTVPEHVVLNNLTIRNYHNSFACVRIVGGAGSTVGETGIDILDCNLQATASGNRQLWVSSVDKVTVRGGTFRGSSASSLGFVEECALFAMTDVANVANLQLDYDTTGNLPSLSGSTYIVSGCPLAGYSGTFNPQIRSTLLGDGGFYLLDCGRAARVTVSGDQSFTIAGTDVASLTVNNTTAGRMVGSAASVQSVAGTATLDQPLQQGSVAFAASSSQAVVLPAALPNSSYRVHLEVGAAPAGQEVPFVTAKTGAGFTINFTSAQTLTVNWSVVRAQ
jgi:hypothetical protein